MPAQDTSWQAQLIGVFLLVCHHFQESLAWSVERFSNNKAPQFTDEEVMTIYLFGTLHECSSLQAIHR